VSWASRDPRLSAFGLQQHPPKCHLSVPHAFCPDSLHTPHLSHPLPLLPPTGQLSAGRVSPGYDVFFGVGASGTLYAWGADPTNAGKLLLKPTPYGDPTKKWAQVGTGVRFGCGIPLGGGPPICWDLGGSSVPSDAVSAAANITDSLTQLSVGSYHVCGVSTAGKLICWGDGKYGALGNGVDDTDITFGSPDGTDWASVSAGDSFTCALKTDASLYCFGRNSHHEVSPSNDTAVLTPYQVPGTWKSVSTGESYTLAITGDGDGMGWGRSESVEYDFAEGGMLGTGKPLCFDIATEQFCDVSGGSEDEYAYSLGGLEATEPDPVPVAGGIKWDSLSAGGGISCGVESGTGSAYCWGYTTGEASVEGSPQSGAPKLLDNSTWVEVVVGQSNTRCGYTAKTGSLWCWGRNSFNCENSCPLGDGTRKNSAVPVRVLSDEPWLTDGGLGPAPAPILPPTPAPMPAPAPPPPTPDPLVPMATPPPAEPVFSPPPPDLGPPGDINGNTVPPAPSSAQGAGALGLAAAMAVAALFL
jgi:hypothetical protein